MKYVFSFIATVCLSLQVFAAAEYAPKADDNAEVVYNKARFTVLTSRLIRMEWAEDGHFEDRASFTVINRNLPVPQYSTEKRGNALVINTGDVELIYSGGADLPKIICRYRLN